MALLEGWVKCVGLSHWHKVTMISPPVTSCVHAIFTSGQFLYNAIKVCHSYTQSYMYMYNVHVRIQNLNIFLTNVSHPKGDAISVRGQANVYVSMQRNLI